MNPRTGTFLAATIILLVARGIMWLRKGRINPAFATNQSLAPAWSPKLLLLASFLTLFGELALIRWIAVEVWVFAYFKNLALLLCFLGFGLGCALATERIRWRPALTALLGLLLVIRTPWRQGYLLESISLALGGAGDISIWSAANITRWTYFGAAAALAGCLFALIVLVFIPLGQVVSREMDNAPSVLRAYALNLFASLIGVVTFFLVCRLMLPPALWMGIVILGFALLQSNRRNAWLIASLIIPSTLLLYEPIQRDKEILWTPYQQIQYTREYASNGDIRGGLLQINHTFYQETLNLSPKFLARHPEVGREADYNRYNLPFRFAVPSPKVLIVGSGTGNDVAAALRHGSRSIDAVEIDPAIVDLGRREHPERPYESPLVSVHLGDARNFLKRTNQQYDLILFGLLDSHVEFSDYSNMRIDNFVYTTEAFREAARLLTPKGIIFVKFRVERPWLETRLTEILEQVLDTPPLVFNAEFASTGGATCFVASRGHRVDEALSADPGLADFVRLNRLRLTQEPVPVTTDDWPYLYQRDRRIPPTYFSVSTLVILIALVSYVWVRRANRSTGRFSLFFFAMGAGFLLLETQVISRLALFFGTIWQVNGIVISSLLLALWVANAIAERIEFAPKWIWAALLVTLGFAYWFPFDRIEAPPATVGAIAIGIFCLPVLFAGIFFSSEFKRSPSPSAALNANVLGAVTGGLLENLSLVYGLRALLLVAILLYCLASFGLWQQRTSLAEVG